MIPSSLFDSILLDCAWSRLPTVPLLVIGGVLPLKDLGLVSIVAYLSDNPDCFALASIAIHLTSDHLCSVSLVIRLLPCNDGFAVPLVILLMRCIDANSAVWTAAIFACCVRAEFIQGFCFVAT